MRSTDHWANGTSRTTSRLNAEYSAGIFFKSGDKRHAGRCVSTMRRERAYHGGVRPPPGVISFPSVLKPPQSKRSAFFERIVPIVGFSVICRIGLPSEPVTAEALAGPWANKGFGTLYRPHKI